MTAPQRRKNLGPQKPPARPITRARARLLVAQAAVSELRHHVSNGSEWLSMDLDGTYFDEESYAVMCRELEDLCDMLERRAERMERAQERRARRSKA